MLNTLIEKQISLQARLSEVEDSGTSSSGTKLVVAQNTNLVNSKG